MKLIKVTVVVTVEATHKEIAETIVSDLISIGSTIKSVEVTYVREVKEKQDGE